VRFAVRRNEPDARDQTGGWGVMRVLIIDDSEPMRRMIKTYLADEKSLPQKGKVTSVAKSPSLGR